MSLLHTKVLITGSSRGIGLGLTKSFLDQGCNVIATCRQPEKAMELIDLKKKYPDNLSTFPLDVTSQESHIHLKKSLLDAGVDKLDIVIANAGISNSTHPHDPAIDCTVDDMTNVFQTNVIGTMLTFQTFYSMLVDGKLLVAISSRLGSISLASSYQGGGVTSYRTSKAALNMFAVTFSADPAIVSAGIKLICFHPGWVQTDMGNAGGRTAAVTISQSSDGMADIISKAIGIQRKGKSKKRNSKDMTEFETIFESNRCVFTSFDGEMLPW